MVGPVSRGVRPVFALLMGAGAIVATMSGTPHAVPLIVISALSAISCAASAK